MRRLTAVAGLLLLLPACSSGTSADAPTGRSLPTPLAPTDARVDSLLCDDLRAIVEARRAPALPGEGVDTAGQAAVASAARRVLESAEPSGVLPEDVVQALRAYEARDPDDPARDVVVLRYAEDQCPG